MLRPTGSGAAGIRSIGVRIAANTRSRSSAIGINSVNVTGPEYENRLSHRPGEILQMRTRQSSIYPLKQVLTG